MNRGFWLLLFTTSTVLTRAQEAKQNCAPPLLQKQVRLKGTDSVTVSVTTRGLYQPSPALFRVLQQPAAHLTVGKTSFASLGKLLQHREVLFINEYFQPTEELTTGVVDYTINNISYSQHRFPQLRAKDLLAVIKERRFDSADIDLQSRVVSTGAEDATSTAHASLMTTIVAGAGNSSPFAKGAAVAAKVGSVSFANLFPEPDAFYAAQKPAVQNHSYGTVVEHFYGNEAAAYDRAAAQHSNTLFVFSAGNAGTTVPAGGTYTGLAGFANFTGNFKQAKNGITVGATDSLNQVVGPSSKGPAYDGRLKPELVAFGEDGSSGAAALVSGAALLVADAYLQQTGSPAPSILTKTVLLNSADDIGAPGIDYSSGLGSLNAYKAIQTINRQQFFLSSLAQAENKTFVVEVPAGAARLKVTVAWHDPAATPGSKKALHNNIDALLLHTAGNQRWQPWVLSAHPHPDSLRAPARRGIDTLNNIEHFSIDNPAAGTYQLHIAGSQIATAVQTFAVAYQIDSVNEGYFHFPSGSDAVLAGSRTLVRWRAWANLPATLAFSFDRSNWTTVANIPALAAGQAFWQAPDTTAVGFLRVSVPATGMNFISDSFAISRQLPLQTGFDCGDSLSLFWPALGNRPYQLLQLNNGYLSVVKTTTDTAVFLQRGGQPHFAVVPIIGNKAGFRSNTINYKNAGVGCYLRGFFLQSQSVSGVSFTAQLGSLFSVQALSFQKLKNGTFTDLQIIAPSGGNEFLFEDAALVPGENRYRLKINLQNGGAIYSQTEIVYHSTATNPVIVYPNPVRHAQSLQVIVPEAGRYQLTVVDASGRVVLERMLNRTVSSLPNGQWSKGLYFLLFRDREGKTVRQKLIVQ